jgi:hypothetical protein
MVLSGKLAKGDCKMSTEKTREGWTIYCDNCEDTLEYLKTPEEVEMFIMVNNWKKVITSSGQIEHFCPDCLKEWKEIKKYKKKVK